MGTELASGVTRMLRIEVVFLGVAQQFRRAVELPASATVGDAIHASDVLAQVPELASESLDVGIFNRRVAPDTPLRDGDRVEIYRPLTIDPKQARRVRAEVRRRRKRAG